MRSRLAVIILLLFFSILQLQHYYKVLGTRKKTVQVRFQLANTAALFKSLEALSAHQLVLQKVEYPGRFLKVTGKLLAMTPDEFLTKVRRLRYVHIYDVKVDPDGVFKFICAENSLIF